MRDTPPKRLVRVVYYRGLGWPKCYARERTVRTYDDDSTGRASARRLLAEIKALPTHHELVGVWIGTARWKAAPEMVPDDDTVAAVRARWMIEPEAHDEPVPVVSRKDDDGNEGRTGDVARQDDGGDRRRDHGRGRAREAPGTADDEGSAERRGGRTRAEAGAGPDIFISGPGGVWPWDE